MSPDPTLLRALLRQRHWQTYNTFCAEYDKAARKIDKDLVRSWPSRGQLHRWTSGQVRGLPYPHHCRVLEAMFPGWSAEQLFQTPPALTSVPSNGAVHVANGNMTHGLEDRIERIGYELSQPGSSNPGRFADVTEVFATRSEFMSNLPPHALFDGAKQVRAAGLSLNLLCQQYPEHAWRRLVERGGQARLLFLRPDGDATRAREREEGYDRGHLQSLTELNIRTMVKRVRERLPDEQRERFELATYDEPVRFNLVLVDDDLCVMQPYLPAARGVDSPTFVLRRASTMGGLFATFEEVFSSLWQRGRPV